METNGEAVAQVYVFRSKYQHLVDPREWDVEKFAEEGLAEFLSHYEGFF